VVIRNVMPMTVKDILEKCNALRVQENRTASGNYAELVFFTKDMKEWIGVFDGLFGPAKKPAGKKPSGEDESVTKPYGGIFDNQVLYSKDEDGASFIAMFWPWQNGTSTTLKIACLKSAAQPASPKAPMQSSSGLFQKICSFFRGKRS
jgi:hypothetical protein